MLASMTWIRPALLWTTWTTLPLAAALERPEELHGSGSAGLMPPLLAGQHLKSPAWGVHTIHIWMREDGQIVDKLLVTTNASFIPTGLGPPESERVGQVTAPRFS